MKKRTVYKQGCGALKNCGLRKGDSHKDEIFDSL